MRKHAFVIATVVTAFASVGASAQNAWPAERFSDYGFSINVPPAWQVIARPAPGDSTFKISKQVSADLVDVCMVHVHDRASNGVSQQQIDEYQAKKFYGSPVPDQQTLAAEKARLEQAIGREGFPVKVEAVGLDKLAGHPSLYYTYMRSGLGAGGDLRQFAYVLSLETPQRAFTLLCQSTSRDADKARSEFGQKIYAEIIPFFKSFALL
jgi:hypothetical protein